MPQQNRRNRQRPKKSFKKKVLAVINSASEMKDFSETATSSGITASSKFDDSAPGAILQGDGNNQRVGDEIRIKDIHFKAMVNCGSANGLVRCYCIQQLSDVQPTGIDNLLPNDFFPSLDISKEKYKVLYDKMVSLDADGKSNHLFNVRLPVAKLAIKKLNFETGATTLTGGGKVMLVITTNNATASQITVDCNYRLRYYD